MFERFEQYLRKQDKAEGTVTGYQGDLEKFRGWFEQDTGETLESETVTAMDVIAYRKHLMDAKLEAATINRSLTSIRQWLRWAGSDEANNVRHIKVAGRLAPKGLERRQVARLLRVAKRGRHPPRDLALVTLMVETGLRVGEVAGLLLDDLTIRERSGWVRVRGAKGLKERRVPLNVGARRALKGWLEIRPACGEDAVFLSQKGGGLSKNGMQRVIAGLAGEAGIEMSAHTLRHTFATNYLERSKDLVGLSWLLGHRNINSTAVYVQPTMADLAERVEDAGMTG
jgi:integrase/recombinase XerC